MDEEALLSKRADGWRRLEELCGKASGGFRRLNGPEVIEYVRLYRQASADLAQFMTHSSNADVVEYLNTLVGRAYGQLYRAPAKPLGAVVVSCLRTAAQTVRRSRWFLLASVAVFLAGAVFAGGMLAAAPQYRKHIVPPQMEGLFAAWKSGKHERQTGATSLLMAASYAGHNPIVSIGANAVAAGSFGVATAVILWQNGAILGALAADMASVGKLGFLTVSILPHGVSEIGGIFIAAAGGFVLAWALICPGRRSRGEALRRAGKDSLTLVCVAMAMTLLAAPVEGFISFNPGVPNWAKLAFAAVTLVAWLAFFTGYAKAEEPEA